MISNSRQSNEVMIHTRLSRDLHRRARISAFKRSQTLSAWVNDAVRLRLANKGKRPVQHRNGVGEDAVSESMKGNGFQVH